MEVKISKMNLSEEPGEVFVLKSEESTKVTKTVTVEIHDFTKKIDDIDNKKKEIKGPKFKVGEKEFYISIYPEDHHDGSSHIAVYLSNPSKDKIKASYMFKHDSGTEMGAINQEIDAGDDGKGPSKFLSHVDYKKWAEDHGDVFRVEVEITLHVEQGNPEPEWETVPRKR